MKLLVLAIVAATALQTAVGQDAPECRNPQQTEFMDVINARALQAIRARQGQIDGRIRQALAQLGGGGNMLRQPVALAGDSATVCIATAPRVCAWGYCAGGGCITTGSYGFSGSVSGLSIQNNDIGINLDDATMCSIVPTDAGMNSNMTGHLTITVGEVEIVASLNAYARLLATISGSIGVTARFRLQPLRVGWEADVRMEYLHPERQCTIHNFHELAINFPPPTLLSYTIDRSGFWGTIVGAISNIAELIMGDLNSQLQTAINAEWATGGVQNRMENVIQDTVAAAEEGVQLICPECPPGQSGSPIIGCAEIDACVSNPCAPTSICADLTNGALDNNDGRTCTACTDGSRPRQNQCTPCASGTAGTGGRCVNCDPAANQFTASPGQTSCTVGPDCAPGTYVSSQPTASSARVCTPSPTGTFTDEQNQNDPRPYQVCGSGTRETVAPTASNDRVCAQCGQNEYQPQPAQTSCLSLTICQPSERVVVAAADDNTTDRTCASCPEGFFSNVTNSPGCQRHRVCPDHQFIENNGSLIRDYICGDHTDCVPGQFVTMNASRQASRQCGSCGAGTFTEGVNDYTCHYHRNCSLGQYVNIQPLPGLERTCLPCAEGEFSGAFNSDACEPWSLCAAGQYDVSASGPTSQNDRDCQSCSQGQFSLGTNTSTTRPGRRRRRSAARRQNTPSAVWLCADECAQRSATLTSISATVPCTQLVVDECTEINFGAFEIGTYMTTPSGAFYWKLIRNGQGYAIHMHPDSRCDSTIDEATVAVVPTDAMLAVPSVGPLVSQMGFCTASSDATSCTQISIGMTIEADALDECNLIDYHTDPSLLRYMLENMGDGVPVIFNVEFREECRPLPNNPDSCPVSTTAPTTGRRTTTVPPPTAWQGCSASEFPCVTGNQCVPSSARCDGHLNCADNSDEAGCVRTTAVPATTTVPPREDTTATLAPTTTYVEPTENTDACRNWRTCRPGEYVAVAGTAANNQECGDCAPGLAYTDTANQASCATPSDCAPGTMMTSNTTSRSDRECQPCPHGFYTSDINQVATAWSICVPGSHVAVNGTTTNDRQCAQCILNHTFQPAANQTACTLVSNCPGGTGVTLPTLTTDRTCQSCPAGTWKGPSESFDTNCVNWRGCAPGFFISTNGSNTNDEACSPCPNGRFTSEPSRFECSLPQSCPAGSYIGVNVSSTGDQRCRACLVGKFSGVNQHECVPWTVCNRTLGLFASNEANSTTDTECGLGSTNDAQGSNANDELSKESTLGIVAGGIVLVLLLAGLAAYFVLVRGKKSSQTSGELRPGFENPLYDTPPPANFGHPEVPDFSSASEQYSAPTQQSGANGRKGSDAINFDMFAPDPTYGVVQPTNDPPSASQGYVDVSHGPTRNTYLDVAPEQGQGYSTIDC